MLVTVDVTPLDPRAAGDSRRVAELVGIVNDAYAVGEAGLWIQGTDRTRPDEIADAIRGGGMLAAMEGTRLVGCASLRRLDADTADLGLVSVPPPLWGRGVGRALVASAEERMRLDGVSTMQLELLVPTEWVHPEKDRLSAWYSRLGYAVVRTAHFAEIAAHLEPRLVTPCEFLVFQKQLA